jgi:hypothetical protein
LPEGNRRDQRMPGAVCSGKIQSTILIERPGALCDDSPQTALT